jgi:hypothetical protein
MQVLHQPFQALLLVHQLDDGKVDHVDTLLPDALRGNMSPDSLPRRA